MLPTSEVEVKRLTVAKIKEALQALVPPLLRACSPAPPASLPLCPLTETQTHATRTQTHATRAALLTPPRAPSAALAHHRPEGSPGGAVLGSAAEPGDRRARGARRHGPRLAAR